MEPGAFRLLSGRIPDMIVLMSGGTWQPSHDELVADLRLVRKHGLVALRKLRPNALWQAARLQLRTEQEIGPADVEAFLRAAVEKLAGGLLEAAAAYTFGCAAGTRDWPAQDRRKAAARAYGVSVERFRKAQEPLVFTETAEAILRLCTAASKREAGEPTGLDDAWHFASFVAVVRLDRVPVEAWETRVVVADMDHLGEVEHAITIPRAPDEMGSRSRPELDTELVYGGRLRQVDHPSDTYFRHVIELAESLPRGARRTYVVRLRLPAGQRMAPHYVFFPLRRCDSFLLHVRFDLAALPNTVWKLDGVPPRTVDDESPPGEVLRPDKFGEISTEFASLKQGHGYGLKWRDLGS